MKDVQEADINNLGIQAVHLRLETSNNFFREPKVLETCYASSGAHTEFLLLLFCSSSSGSAGFRDVYKKIAQHKYKNLE